MIWHREKLLTAKGAKIAKRSRREAVLVVFPFMLEHGKHIGMDMLAILGSRAFCPFRVVSGAIVERFLRAHAGG